MQLEGTAQDPSGPAPRRERLRRGRHRVGARDILARRRQGLSCASTKAPAASKTVKTDVLGAAPPGGSAPAANRPTRAGATRQPGELERQATNSGDFQERGCPPRGLALRTRPRSAMPLRSAAPYIRLVAHVGRTRERDTASRPVCGLTRGDPRDRQMPASQGRSSQPRQDFASLPALRTAHKRRAPASRPAKW